MTDPSPLSTASAGFAVATGRTTSAPDLAPGAATAAAESAAGDFQSFLQLLTTQLRNQDPLKPMESNEFVAQLASFSAVEQQVQSNHLLEQMLAALGQGSAGGLAQWIGLEVRSPGAASYETRPLDVRVDIHPQADRSVMIVRDASGHEVSRREISTNAANVLWSGETASGTPAPPGAYMFDIESWQGDTLLGTREGMVFAPVTEVRLAEGRPQLYFADGSWVWADMADAVRAAEAA